MEIFVTGISGFIGSNLIFSNQILEKIYN